MEAKTVSVLEPTAWSKIRELQGWYTLHYGVDMDYALTLIRRDCLEIRKVS